MKKWKYIIELLAVICLIGGCTMNDMEDGAVDAYYREGLKQFLLKELDLKEYDFMLEESGMNYVPNDEETKSGAQKAGDLGLKYLYFRNNLYLERLNEKDIETLEDEMKKNKGSVSEEAMKVIESTYAKVITPIEIVAEEDKEVLTYYDSAIAPDFVTIDSLVLKIGTMGEFDENGNYVNREHEDEKRNHLMEFAENMEISLKGRLGEVPVRVLVEY